MDRLRSRIESFLTALEGERYELDLAQRRRPELGELYQRASDLFSIDRITEVQRALAGSGGVEERRHRALLEFLAGGRALAAAGDPLDQKLAWEVFGSVPVEENRIPVRQIEGALAVAGDPERRHAISDAYHQVLAEQDYLAIDFLRRHRDGIAELGYGSHAEAFQVLGSIDLQAIVREGERFLEQTEGLYRELLAWHLPRVAGVEPREARAADGVRLAAAPDYDTQLRGGEGNRAILEAVAATGLDPLAEGRIVVEWDAYLGAAAGAACRTLKVPEEIRLSVTPRSGRTAVESFLGSYGTALHAAYTDPALPVEQRRLGDASVPRGVGALFESLLRTPDFLTRVLGFGRNTLPDFLRLTALCTLLGVRRDVGLLRYELAHYSDAADPSVFADSMTQATGLAHDARAAAWSISGDFTAARRLRGAQLGGVIADTLRNRFDADWFRNPSAGEHLRGIFENGRRYSATELAVQLSSSQLSWAPLIASLNELA